MEPRQTLAKTKAAKIFAVFLATTSLGCQILGGISDDLTVASDGGGTGGEGGTGLPVRDPFIWTATDPGPTFVYQMPDWLDFSSYTDGTTSQVGPSTLRVGYKKNDPRPHNIGEGWGLLMEPKRTNYLPYSDWVLGTTPGSGPAGPMEVTLGLDDPSGGNGAVQFKSAGSQQSDILAATGRVASTWIRSAAEANPAAYFAYGPSHVPVDNTAGAWRRIWVTRDLQEMDTRLRMETQAQGADPAIAYPSLLDVFGAQIEDGVYPTSFIPTNGAPVTREPDRLTIQTETLAPNGYFDVTIRIAPHYSVATQTIDHDIVGFKKEAVYVRLRPPGRALLITPALPENVELDGLSWGKNDEFEIRARYLPNLREITVGSVATGKRTASIPGPVPPLKLDDFAWLLCNGDGPQEAVDLRFIEVR